MRIVICSDLDITSDDATRARRVVAHAAKHADHVVVAGGVVRAGLAAQAQEAPFDCAERLLAPLIARSMLTVLPAAHERDIVEKRLAGLITRDVSDYAVHGAFPCATFVGMDAAVVAVDTCCEGVDDSGIVGTTQLDALASILDDERVRGRAVVEDG